MITNLIYDIAVVEEPKWTTQHYGMHKLSNNTSGSVYPSSWTNTVYSLCQFNDGTRSLNFSGGTRYIDPFGGTSLSTSHSSVNNKIFTSRLSYPLNSSTYSNSYANGIYMNDTDWEELTTTTGSYWGNTLVVINNGAFQSNGSVVVESTNGTVPIPPYNSSIYTYIGSSTTDNNPNHLLPSNVRP